MKSKIREYTNLKIKTMSKSTVLCTALLLSTLAVSAQNEKKAEEKKKATVHIKKIENINGVEKITDTIYTVDDASSLLAMGPGNIQISDVKDGKGDGKTVKVFIVNDEKVSSNNDEKMDIKVIEGEGGWSEEVQRALKESGVDPKDCKGEKKTVIISEDTNTKDGKSEKKMTKIVMVKLNITDASADDMKRLNTQLGKPDNKLQMEEMKMFPNPHDGRFNLSFNLKDKGDAKVSIFNVDGKEVYAESLPNFTGSYSKDIDISNNKKGVYFVKIVQGSHSQVKKVVLE
jgi:hypothetical protein